MLDFFYSISHIYDRFRSQMTGSESCANILPLAKTGCDYRLMMLVDLDGKIANTSLLQKDDEVFVYKLNKNKTFPRLRFSNINHEQPERGVRLFMEQFRLLIDVFAGTPQELPDSHAIHKLHDAMTKLGKEPDVFAKTIVAAAMQAINNANQDPKKVIDVNKIDIVFDVDCKDNFQSSINDLAQRKNKLCQDSNTSETSDIFGNEGEIANEAFGQVHNWLSLFQRDENVQSYASYGLNSVDACPLTAFSRLKIHEVASWILDEKHKSIFWNRRIFDNRTDIVVVVPEISNESNIDCISDLCFDIIGDEEFLAQIDSAQTGDTVYSTADESIEKYSEKSVAAIASLVGVIKDNPFAKFKGFVASRKDKNAFGVTANLDFSVQNLIDAIAWWKKCCQESVRRQIPKFAKGKFVGYHQNRPVHPFQIPRIMNIHWSKGAGVNSAKSLIPKYCDKITFERFTQADAISLFLEKNKTVANRLIREFVEHHSNLMIDVVRRDNRKESACLLGSRLDVFSLPCLMSIALSVKGIDKMEMENKIGYIFGQVMGIADWLHAARCHYRQERLPSELIGSRFATVFAGGYKLAYAMQNFARDFRFITDWCKSVLYNNNVEVKNRELIEDIIKKYRWFEKLMNKINSKMPERLSVDDTAMFHLGYYSVRAFSPHKNSEKTNSVIA